MQMVPGGQALDSAPRFSIVICTDGRVEALQNTLRSLDYLDYQSFEVCIVHGPTVDGTRELLEEYSGRIKVANNPDRNLSMSRNIGIAIASGDIIAFIDDDAIPEPEWLHDLAAAYADPKVGGVGGFVYDHLGTRFQYRFSTANRLGRQQFDATGPVDNLSFPLTANFPHLQGTNSSFRRSALLEIGAFDEEYEYYLDETDVILRLVDAGWVMRILEGAHVHHKFLPSSMRSVAWENRVLQHWYPIVKNKLYFSLRHAIDHYRFNDIINDTRAFIDELARDVDWAVSRGVLDENDLERFGLEVDRAWRDGLQRGLNGEARLIGEATLANCETPFLPFTPAVPEGGRRTFCFVSQEYMPGQMGGIGRYTHELAESIAHMGHHVHVITRGIEYDRVDFNDGVWVHYVTDKEGNTVQPQGLRLPAYIWNRATTVARTLDGIASKRQITAVSAPIWDCESIAVLAEGRYPVVTALQTSMAFYLASNPTHASDKTFLRDTANPLIDAEKRVMRESDRIIGCTRAIVEEIEEMYDIRFDPERLSLIPYGIGDWSSLPREAPDALPEGTVRLLFVGRLEERKGIDVLLSCAKRILARHPNVYLDIVGNDKIPGPGGKTFREIFEADRSAGAVRNRVLFHGAVSDERLRGFYAASDLVVAPSRFESFGLMLVEAMMFGKPVVACNTGGMPEVAESGVTGLLAKPGDEPSLEACIEQLLEDANLRARMAVAARARYETHFDVKRIADTVVASLIDASKSAVLPAKTQRAKQTYITSLSAVAAGVLARQTPGPKGTTTRTKHKVVIVAPMMARYDAISAAARDTYRMLTTDKSLDVAVLTYRNDFPDVQAHTISSLEELLTHRAFLDADLIIYHFGIFNELLNALICGNGHARQVVRFHNITPMQLAMPSQASIIRKSFRQIANLLYADEIWADSQVNKDVLEEHDIPGDRIIVLPLVVDEPEIARARDKSNDRLDLLYVGRCVPSKGLLDLVQAIDLVPSQSFAPIRLRIAGSEEWSDEAYLRKVKFYVKEHRLAEIVEFCGAVDNKQRDKLYHEAHILAIPSYHEGFCKPVVEGLRSGCIPVGYTSSNLPAITNGLGRLVPPGDIAALAAAFADVFKGLGEAFQAPNVPVLPLDRGATVLQEFEAISGEYVKQFTFDGIAAETLRRSHAMIARVGVPSGSGQFLGAATTGRNRVSSTPITPVGEGEVFLR